MAHKKNCLRKAFSGISTCRCIIFSIYKLAIYKLICMNLSFRFVSVVQAISRKVNYSHYHDGWFVYVFLSSSIENKKLDLEIFLYRISWKRWLRKKITSTFSQKNYLMSANEEMSIKCKNRRIQISQILSLQILL